MKTPEPGAAAPAKPAETGARRLMPRLPGAGLPRSFGLFLTVVTILAIEILHKVGLVPPVPAGFLILAVALAAYLDGARQGLLAGGLAFAYEIYAYLQHGTVLADPSYPWLRAVGLGLITFAVIGMVATFRRRLDGLLQNERVLVEQAEAARQHAERGRQELAEALVRVELAQEALRMQASLLTAVGEGIAATDEAGRIIYWNEPAERLFGRSVAQVATRPIDEVMPDPPGVPVPTLKRIAHCDAWAGELSVRRPDGTLITVLASDSPIRSEAGGCTGMVRVLTDVTAQKQAERTQRLLADAGSALAASLDYESTLRTVARLCVPVFADGCAVDVVEADGMAWRLETAHEDPRVEEAVRGTRRRHPLALDSDDPTAGVIRTGLPVFATSVTEAALEQFARDREHFESLRAMDIASVIAVPLRATGRTLGAMTFWRGALSPRFRESDLLLAEEIASRAATAIQQARLFETALGASKAKSDFLAVMSHELRTPLTTIVGYTDLMLDGVPQPMPEAARTYSGRIRVAARHLLGLIEQILIYARTESGREQPRPERIELAGFLRETAALVEPVALERGIGFAVELPDAELGIETDATKLRQILLNLLSNAVKFTEAGGVRLTAEPVDGKIAITVSDTGIGIAAEHLTQVFDPFWQVDQSPTRRAGGTGLGLAVSRRLATWLGGDIRVRSEEGQGTAFTVTLPMRWTGPEGRARNPSAAQASAGPVSSEDANAYALDPAAARD
jgi:PAS domain S-box-containing protein